MLPALLLAICAAVVAYILIGYPLLLAAHWWKAAPAIRKDLQFQAPVTVILAVYNGGQFLRRKLDSLLATNYPAALLNVLVVSDGSTDETEAIAEEYKERNVRLLREPHRGKASALNRGLAEATGDIIFFTDVRQPLDPDALAHLVANFADPSVGAVTGEMRLRAADAGEQADMDLYWRYELWVRQKHSAIDSIFTATGCIYAMRRELAEPIPPDTLSDDAFIPLRAFFRGYRVVFDPRALAFDQPALAGSEFRRRWRNLAGLWQIHARMPALFTARNRMLFHFLSHKFSRLVLPWAIALGIAGTIALPASVLRATLLWALAGFLAIAALDWMTPKRWWAKRITSPARTFLLMNAASLFGVAVFFVPPQRLWKPTRVAGGR
ncbi:MAG TPA: glycosyltransferase family 2 protein [Bryobacteraceae bacterium]|nr:glycosyltransferase family 2 protein [Bryobacteraceae bacterium]